MVEILETPRARDASLNVGGTDFNASSDAAIIVGRIKKPKVREPDRIEDPNLKYTTKRASPKSPKTTEGTPAKLFIPIEPNTKTLGEVSLSEAKRTEPWVD